MGQQFPTANKELVASWFPGKVRGGKLLLNEAGTLFVNVDVFATLFKDVPENPTYDDFVAIDGGLLGYIPFFYRCKTEGILN